MLKKRYSAIRVKHGRVFHFFNFNFNNHELINLLIALIYFPVLFRQFLFFIIKFLFLS